MPDIAPLPPISGQPLSVVLIAHNADEHLHGIVTRWLDYLAGLDRDYEVILVDDGSNDRTAAIIAGLAEQFPRLLPIRHATHQGEGAALRTAVALARHPLLFYTLCDLRYRPAHLNRLLVEPGPAEPDRPPCPLIDMVHLTVGYHSGVREPLLWSSLGLVWRLLCWLLFNVPMAPSLGWLGWRRRLAWLITRILFGIRNGDVTCPVRLLRREILERMPLQSDGSFVHAEILAKANFLTLLVSEDVPLGDRQRPVPPRREENPRQWLRDLGRVFWRPDFGPVGSRPVPPDAGS